jgi:hypothetical protein
VVQEKHGWETFSKGPWASAATIDWIGAELDAERSTKRYVKMREAASRRREQAQAEYVEDLHGAVAAFLDFHAEHAGLADRLARAVADHATPVGSGTVAHTTRIPIEQRAEVLRRRRRHGRRAAPPQILSRRPTSSVVPPRLEPLRKSVPSVSSTPPDE